MISLDTFHSQFHLARKLHEKSEVIHSELPATVDENDAIEIRACRSQEDYKVFRSHSLGIFYIFSFFHIVIRCR